MEDGIIIYHITAIGMKDQMQIIVIKLIHLMITNIVMVQKLWLVPTDAIDGNTVDWTQANEFLFETDLIWYSNSADTLTVPANSFIEFYPQFEVNEYATGGLNIIKITVA